MSYFNGSTTAKKQLLANDNNKPALHCLWINNAWYTTGNFMCILACWVYSPHANLN